MRIERLIFCLQGYDVKITHVSIDENTSDYSSRHPSAHSLEDNQYFKKYISFICKNACPKAITLDDIKQLLKTTKRLRN